MASQAHDRQFVAPLVPDNKHVRLESVGLVGAGKSIRTRADLAGKMRRLIGRHLDVVNYFHTELTDS